MNMLADVDTETRWQDCMMVTAGIAYFASPFLMAYSQKPIMHNALLTGLAITAFALLAIFSPSLWEEAVLLMLGCWSVASPWVLEFDDNSGAAITSVVAGGVVLLSALWAMKEEDSRRTGLAKSGQDRRKR